LRIGSTASIKAFSSWGLREMLRSVVTPAGGSPRLSRPPGQPEHPMLHRLFFPTRCRVCRGVTEKLSMENAESR